MPLGGTAYLSLEDPTDPFLHGVTYHVSLPLHITLTLTPDPTHHPNPHPDPTPHPYPYPDPDPNPNPNQAMPPSKRFRAMADLSGGASPSYHP